MLGLNLGKPVNYTMNVAPDGRKQKVTLSFRNTYVKSNLGTGMDILILLMAGITEM